MYERFTDRGRKVMQLANHEAQRFNHEYIGTEHVLLGLVKEGSGVAANVLKNLDIDLRKVRLEVEKLIQSGPEMVTMGKLPQTPRTKKVMEKAMETSRELNHNYVGTEHILLGLIQIEGVALDVLGKLGVTAEHARVATLALLGHGADDTDDLVRDCNSWPHPWYHSATREERPGRSSLVDQAKIGFPPFRQPQQLNPLITALNRKWRNSVLIIGERGVGKRALVERLAHEIASGHSSVVHACGKRLTELCLADSAARVEKRVSKVSTEGVLLVDNIHLGLDYRATEEVRRPESRRRRRQLAVEPSPLLTRILATWLSKGGRCIATTTEDHVDTFLACEELSVYFSPLRLAPATSGQSIEIAKSRADEYEHNQSVRFDDEAYREACELAEQYGELLYPGHAQPELTLDVLEYAAAYTDWKQQSKDAKAAADGDDPVVELHAHDIQHSVAMRLGKDIGDVKARK